jgi:hypothetical protein
MMENKLKQARQTHPEDIENQLKLAMRKNDQYLYIVETDDLIAAWCYERKNKFIRSIDPSRVPTQYRYSAPPSDSSRMIACHVGFDTKPSHRPFVSGMGPQISCTNCRTSPFQPEPRWFPSINELQAVGFTKRNVAPYIAPFVDGVTLARLVKDLGINGKAVTKEVNGRQYVIFSGYAGHRTLFRGTRYSQNNHKIIQMGIGKMGIKHMVKSGARLTIYLTVPLSVLEVILSDEVTMSRLLGTVAANLVKVGLAAIAGAVIGVVSVMIFKTVAVPVVLAIVISLAIGHTVDAIDKQYGLTQKIAELIESYLSQEQGVFGKINDADSSRHNKGSSIHCHGSS